MKDFTSAVRLACKNGWMKGKMNGERQQLAYLLDPAFWQALGKALGWSRGYDLEADSPTSSGTYHVVWLKNWHRYIDARANGSEEQFWAEILKDKDI